MTSGSNAGYRAGLTNPGTLDHRLRSSLSDPRLEPGGRSVQAAVDHDRRPEVDRGQGRRRLHSVILIGVTNIPFDGIFCVYTKNKPSFCVNTGTYDVI